VADAEGTVVRPSGDLDIATAPAFRAMVDGALFSEPRVLVVDLTDVAFLDSSGIAVLAVALRTQRSRDAGLVVRNPRPIVRKAIELVGLGSLLEEA
jgi:anti-anti-sigma factor